MHFTPMEYEDELKKELNGILLKTMELSYKRNEVDTKIEQLEKEADKRNKKEYDQEKMRKLRMDLESIRKEFYGF